MQPQKYSINHPKYHIKHFLSIWIILLKMVTAVYNTVGEFWGPKTEPISCFQVNSTL